MPKKGQLKHRWRLAKLAQQKSMLLLHHKQILKWQQVLNPLTSCSYLADDLSMTPLQSSHLSHLLSETSLRLPPLVSHSESLIWQNIQVNAWLKFEMPKTINRIKRSTFFFYSVQLLLPRISPFKTTVPNTRTWIIFHDCCKRVNMLEVWVVLFHCYCLQSCRYHGALKSHNFHL